MSQQSTNGRRQTPVYCIYMDAVYAVGEGTAIISASFMGLEATMDVAVSGSYRSIQLQGFPVYLEVGGRILGVLHYGHTVETGTSEEIFGHLIHPYTKSLLSANPSPNPKVAKKRKVIQYDDATSGINILKAHSAAWGHAPRTGYGRRAL